MPAGCKRFLAGARTKRWWMGPAFGLTAGDVPAETQFLLCELSEGAYALLMTAQLLWCLRKLRARFASEPAQPCASDRAEPQRATPRRGREARAMGYVAL